MTAPWDSAMRVTCAVCGNDFMLCRRDILSGRREPLVCSDCWEKAEAEAKFAAFVMSVYIAGPVITLVTPPEGGLL